MKTKSKHIQNASISSAVEIGYADTKVIAQATGQNIRFTVDGTEPTASRGFVLYAFDPPALIPIPANGTLKVIEEAATATLELVPLIQSR